MTSMGGLIAKARVVRGFDRARLASEAGVRERTIERIEKDLHRPNVKTLAAVALALGVSVDSLIPILRPRKPACTPS